MKQLSLLRHAKSSWTQEGLTDFERPLNERGKRDAPEMGRRLAEAGFRPDQMISSPAKRARSTAKRIAKQIGYDAEQIALEPRIYEASAGTLFEIVQGFAADLEHVVLIGHNPGMTELANALLASPVGELPTCAVVRMRLSVEDWQQIDFGNAQLIDFDFPKRTQ